jgi:hypothetical protein
MLKSGVVSAQRGHGRRPVQLLNAIEGQMAELCRDLEVEAKRMHQLQEQVDELRTVIRQWVGSSSRSRGRSS